MVEVLTGRCLCGAVRYRAEASQTVHYLCHCADCRRYGGGAGHAAIVVAASEIVLTGAPRVHARQADSGRMVARYFCDACGGHLFTSPWPDVTRYSVKAGTLDNPALFRPAHEIWCQSAGAWTDANEKTSYEQGFTQPVTIGNKV